MAISLVAIKAAFDTYAAAVVATAAAVATRTALGARPTFPADATSDASYNNVLTAQATYDTNYDTANTAVNVAKADERTKELLVIAIMPLDQWVQITPTVSGVVTQVGVSSKPLAASRVLTYVVSAAFSSPFPGQIV